VCRHPTTLREGIQVAEERMAKATSKLEKVELRAWDIINEWANKWSARPLPVPLEELARAYKVVRVDVQALLGTAGIEKEGDAFVICVNSEADGVKLPEGATIDVSSETWAKLSRPLRFTLAHELSHLILLQIKSGDVSAFKDCESKLETLCNDMAGALLMPKSKLLDDLANEPFDVNRVIDLASKFRVSADTFVIRLNAPDHAPRTDEPGGILALMRRRDARLEFDAVHVHGWRANQRWDKLKTKAGREKAGVEDLFLRPEVIDQITSCDDVQQKAGVVWRTDTREMLACDLTSRHLQRDPLAVLIGIRITDDTVSGK
jgi:hypothetical protein